VVGAIPVVEICQWRRCNPCSGDMPVEKVTLRLHTCWCLVLLINY